MKLLVTAILPHHGLAAKSLDGTKAYYLGMNGVPEEMVATFPTTVVAKWNYVPLKVPKICTVEQAMQILWKESDEYARLYE